MILTLALLAVTALLLSFNWDSLPGPGDNRDDDDDPEEDSIMTNLPHPTAHDRPD